MRTIALVCLLALSAALAPPARAQVTSTTSQVETTANGVATAFSFTFKTYAASWVKVYVNGVEQASGFTVALASNQDTSPGGTVTFLAAPANGAVVRVSRVVPLTQELVVRDGERFPGKSVTRTFDRLAMGLQQLHRDKRDAATQAAVDAVQSSDISSLALGTPAAGSALVKGRSLDAHFSDVINVKNAPFNAVGDGVANDTAAIQAAVASLPPAGGVIFFPTGTYKANVSIAQNHVTLRGAGRRSSFIVPANAAAAAVTIDASAGPLESNAIEEIGFVSGGTAPALLITGNNINDWISVRRVFIDSYTNGISILGRTIWTRFVDVEVYRDKGRGVYVNTDQAVNHVLFENVRAGEGASDGFYLRHTGAENFFTINLHHCNSEANAGDGIYAENVDQLNVTAFYLENNAGAAIRLAGTFARGFRIAGGLAWGGADGFVLTSTLAVGYIGETVFSNTATNLKIATTHVSSSIVVGPNFYGGTGVNTITPDANGVTHVTYTDRLVLDVSTSTTAPASVAGKGVIQFTNGTPLTLTNLTGGEKGQVLSLLSAGAGGVTLTNAAGGAGQFLFPVASYKLPASASVAIIYDGAAWRLLSSARGTGASMTAIGATTYGASVAINADLGNYFLITPTDANAFAVAAPSGGVAGQRITIAVRNTTGGALGAITWTTGGAGTYRVASFTSPNTGFTSYAEFIYDNSVWRQVGHLANGPN